MTPTAPPTSGAPAPVDAAARADLADLLAAIFARPLTGAAVAGLRAMATAGLFDEIGAMLGCRSAARRMAAALLVGAPEAVARDLQRRHAVLFEGAGGPRTVSLCESAHDENAPRLYGRPVAEMRAVLLRLGMAPAPSCREPEDHLAIQLAALAAALRARDDQAAAALTRRLSRWTPRLRRALGHADPGGFFEAGAAMAAAFAASLADDHVPPPARPIVQHWEETCPARPAP